MAQEVDRVAINGIIDQGLNHSEVMQTAAWLTDRIGGRGLSIDRADPFDVCRG